jgi:hypothetical protein
MNFETKEFAQRSLEDFCELFEEVWYTHAHLGDGLIASAIFGQDWDGDERDLESFDFPAFLHSPQAQAAYASWCKENAQARVEAFEKELEY